MTVSSNNLKIVESKNMSSVLGRAENELKLENASYVENMISNIELGTGVLMEDSGKPEFADVAKGASEKMQSLNFEQEESEDSKNVSLNYENYRSFFNYMRGVLTDVDGYRKELQKNFRAQSKIQEEKLEREVTNIRIRLI